MCNKRFGQEERRKGDETEKGEMEFYYRITRAKGIKIYTQKQLFISVPVNL